MLVLMGLVTTSLTPLPFGRFAMPYLAPSDSSRAKPGPVVSTPS